jgi:poly(hydroxyalkanoate) granule-associated protein
MTATAKIFRLGDLPRNVAEKVTALPRDLAKDVASRGRDVWLAGLGALATVEQEGTTLFDRLVKQGETLVEKGEKLEERGKNRIETVKDDLQARQKEVTGKVSDTVTETFDAKVYEPLMEALKRFGVPTRAEIRGLSANVDALTARVNTLIRILEVEGVDAVARASFAVVARESGWAVEKDGGETAVVDTKDEALKRAQLLARESAPSQLVVYRKDGTVQDTFTYDA